MAKAKKKVTKKKVAKVEENKTKGLGDVVEKITEVTGIKKAVKAVFGDDCGCDERREKLNKLLSFKTAECLNEDEYKVLHEFFKGNPNKIKPTQWNKLSVIAKRIFNKRVSSNMGCGGCVRELVAKLKKLYETYEDKDQLTDLN